MLKMLAVGGSALLVVVHERPWNLRAKTKTMIGLTQRTHAAVVVSGRG